MGWPSPYFLYEKHIALHKVRAWMFLVAGADAGAAGLRLREKSSAGAGRCCRTGAGGGDNEGFAITGRAAEGSSAGDDANG